MSLLDGGIASVFGSVFGGLYPDGLLHRDGTEPVYDSFGNITGYSTAEDIAIKVQRDACSYSMQRAQGFSDGDVMLIILADGLDILVTTDMHVTDGDGNRWMVKSADLDAASSHWVLRGRAA
ncbi:MAG: hypothetical protein A3E01_09245 [Gammaproteobacteria bacterium RIFCSPHIGHO2_12_FULL_63_22]|nr:MAG: hypothetical protein A3E01_09245 [Gammaproteobacteria bacterium RIFCSPHIGHO2_12_FULL_63_22]